jgi:hypothetical protein
MDKVIVYTLMLVGIATDLSCSNGELRDRKAIISLVFNSQIGYDEHRGSSPPAPPVPPDFESLQKYKTKEDAKLHLNSKEWVEFFKEDELHESRVQKWEERVEKIDKKIIFLNKTKFTQSKDFAGDWLEEYGFNDAFLDIPTTWEVSDIANESNYEIIEYSEFGSSKLDSIHVGVMSFSEVVFNPDKTEAAICFDWACGGECGFGNLAILKKVKNKWEIIEIIGLWIS